MCGRAGTYSGTWVQTAGSDSDNGTWTFTVDTSGTISGSALSEVNTEFNPISIDGDVTSGGASSFMGTGTTSVGATFSGSVALDGSVTGTWENTTYGSSGTYTGSRTAGPSTPCTSTGGTDTGTGSDFGSLTLSGQDTFGTGFTPLFVAVSSSGSSTVVVWDDSALLPTGTDRMLQVAFNNSSGLPLSVHLSGINDIKGQTWGYAIDCYSTDCSGLGVTFDQVAGQVTFNSIVLPTANLLPNPSDGPITMNGTLSYPPGG